MEQDYEVGWCKPPVKTRFGKGNKAAAGRKRKKPAADGDLGEFILRYLAEEQNVKVGGKVTSQNLVHVIIHLILVESYKVGLKDKKFFLQFLQKWGLLDLHEQLRLRAQDREEDAESERESAQAEADSFSERMSEQFRRKAEAERVILVALEQCTCGVVSDPEACAAILTDYQEIEAEERAALDGDAQP